MDISFEEYEDIIREQLIEDIRRLKINDIKDKKQSVELSKSVLYIFTAFVIPALSPFNLNVVFKRKGSGIHFDFIHEKLYEQKLQAAPIKVGTLDVKFKKNTKTNKYKFMTINFKLNPHYFLIYGNIDKIR